MKVFFSLFSIYFVYAIFSASWVSTGLFISQIETDFHINTFKAALLTNIVSFAKIFGSLFAGFIFSKLGLKWGYLIGCLFISFGAFGVGNYEFMLVGRFFMGLGSAVAVVALVPIAKALLDNPNKILSINSTANTFGNFIGISLLGYFGMFYWKDLFIFFAILNIVFLLIFFFSFDTKSAYIGEKNTVKLQKNHYKIIFFMVFAYVDAVFLLNIFFVYFPKVVGQLYFELASSFSHFLNIINISIICCGFLGSFLSLKLGWFKNILISKALIFFVIINIYFLHGSMQKEWFLYMLGGGFGLSYGILFANIFLIGSYQNSLISAKIMGIFWAFSYGFLVINSQIFAKLMSDFNFFVAMRYFCIIFVLSFFIVFFYKKTINFIENKENQAKI